MRSWIRHHLILVALGLGMASCTTLDICDDTGQADLVVRFKYEEGDDILDTIFSEVTVYGIREGKTDSLLLDAESASKIVLPLNPHAEVSSFFMQINDLSDTIHISHNTGFYLMSYTCGYASVFTLEADPVEHDTILFYAVDIRKAVIDAETDQNEEHLWLYF
jgi:hypothetical protein